VPSNVDVNCIDNISVFTALDIPTILRPMKKVFVAQPAYGAGCFERGSEAAPDHCMDAFAEIAKMPYESSLLANGFNKCLCACLNLGTYDYFCLLHGDVIPAPQGEWLSILVDELEAHRFDAIHAPCAIKDGRGLTSTAIAFSANPWERKRRITTRELHQLPETFDVADVRRVLEPRAYTLLPNTGCLLFSAKAEWICRFPGFEIRDRITWEGNHYAASVVPEDWHFGYWMAEMDLKVGGTRKVTPRHVGKIPFMTEVPWGVEHDEQFFEGQDPVQSAA
jgi:hypothetical protein